MNFLNELSLSKNWGRDKTDVSWHENHGKGEKLASLVRRTHISVLSSSIFISESDRGWSLVEKNVIPLPQMFAGNHAGVRFPVSESYFSRRGLLSRELIFEQQKSTGTNTASPWNQSRISLMYGTPNRVLLENKYYFFIRIFFTMLVNMKRVRDSNMCLTTGCRS